ncbi:hypothetical protein QUA86_08545 [Microcoleus sp. F6_B6]
MTKAYLAANQTITKPLPSPARVSNVGLRQCFLAGNKGYATNIQSTFSGNPA